MTLSPLHHPSSEDFTVMVSVRTALYMSELFDMCVLPAVFRHSSEELLEEQENPDFYLAKHFCLKEFPIHLLLICEDLFIRLKSETRILSNVDTLGRFLFMFPVT